MDLLDDRLTRAGAAWRDAQPPMRLPIPATRRAASRRWWSSLGRVAGVAAAAAFVVGVLWVVSPTDTREQGGAPERRPVALLTETARSEVCLFVSISGELGTNPRSGLGLVGPDGVSQPIRWPVGYSAYEAAGQTVLVDASGAPVAMAGDPIGFGSAGTDGGIQTACRPSLHPKRRLPDAGPRGNLERPFTERELAGLARNQRFTRGPSVVVATLVTNPAIDGGAPEGDVVGWLADGLGGVAIRAEAGMLESLRRSGLVGTFAFSIGDDASVTVLGPMDVAAPGALARTVDQTIGDGPRSNGDLVAVDGWLWRDTTACDAPCTWVGVTATPNQSARAGEASAVIPVDPAAWARFGVVGGLDTGLPRPGPWLMQRSGPTWEVVARLEPAASVEIALPTVDTWTGACRGVGLSGAVLHGASDDPRGAWLVNASGERGEVIWPPGYRARFAPTLEVLDGGGTLRFREGDEPTGACTTGANADGPLLLAPDR